MNASPVAAQQAEVLRRALRGLWTGLPTLAVGGTAVAAAGILASGLGRGPTPFALLLGAVLVGPPLAATAAAANDLIVDGEATIPTWWRGLRRNALLGIAILLVPALLGCLFLVAMLALQVSGNLPALAAAFTCGLMAALGVGVALTALVTATARPELTGVALLLTAGHLAVSRPARFLAPLCLLGLGLWMSFAVTGTLLPLVTGPTLMLSAAAFWSTAVEHGATDLDRERMERS